MKLGCIAHIAFGLFLVAATPRVVAASSPPMAPAIRLVAMEPIPLRVPSYLTTSIRGGAGISGAQAGGVATLISVFANKSRLAANSAMASSAIQGQLDREQAWVATLVIAEEFRKQLVLRGYSAELDGKLAPFPRLQDRSYTYFGENWSKAIRAWYGQPMGLDGSPALNGRTASESLEIGLVLYEIVGDRDLAIGIAAKHVMAGTGKVLAKTRVHNAWELPRLKSLDSAFLDDGLEFKMAFSASAEKLVARSLDQLKLPRLQTAPGTPTVGALPVTAH